MSDSSIAKSRGKFGIPEEFRTRSFALTMVAVAVIYSPSLFWALGLDQNIFAELGSLLLSGRKPYLDMWDVKPPNIYYTYAFFESLIGRHDVTVRIADYLFSIASCAVAFLLMQRHLASFNASVGAVRTAPVIASLLLALTFLSLGLADTAQTESFAIFFLLLAAVLLTGESIPSPRLIAAGAAIGIATFFKTTNAIFLLPLVIEVMLSNHLRPVRAVAMLVGGWLAWCALQLGVLALEGSLSEYLHITKSVLLHHPNEISTLTVGGLLRALWTLVDVWTAIPVLAMAYALVQRDRLFLRTLRFPLLYLIAGLIAVFLQNKGWGYQFVIVLPGLVWLCSISASYLYHELSLGVKVSRAPSLALLFSVLLIVGTIAITPSARRRIHHLGDSYQSLTSHQTYLSSLGSLKSLYYPPATEKLADYFRANTNPEDRIFILGEEPGAYWKADRIPATRFTYALLFTSGVLTPEELSAMNDSLIRTKPKLVIVERFDTTSFRGRPETSESLLQSDSLFGPLRGLLKSEYAIADTVAEKFIIYRRS